jgi:hypothetical protein
MGAKAGVPAAFFMVPSYLAILDSLVDDDDDIRDVGARAASAVLRTNGIPFSVAGQLATWLVNEFDHEFICKNMLRRLSGSTQSGNNVSGLLVPVKDQLGAAIKEDHALFVEEEQNLFQDEVREAKVLSKALIQANGSQWDSTKLLLLPWTLEGLSIITELLEEREDGALGWASKPAAFVVGSRVIFAVQILMGSSILDNASITELKSSIDALVKAGLRGNMHPLLLSELQSLPGIQCN